MIKNFKRIVWHRLRKAWWEGCSRVERKKKSKKVEHKKGRAFYQ